MCKCIKKAIITFALATILLVLFIEEYYKKHKFFHQKKSISILSKIANQQSQNQSSPTSSQENSTIRITTQNPQTSTRISFQDNPYTFEERHARLSEPQEPVQRQAPHIISEPTYNLYSTLPQELSRIRNISQNQNTVEIHSWALNRLQYRQDIHEDIREHNNQILQQNSLQLKFEITIKLNNIGQHPYPLNPPNITAQSLPPPFITTEVTYKYDRYTKNTIGYITFYNPYSGLSYTCIF